MLFRLATQAKLGCKTPTARHSHTSQVQPPSAGEARIRKSARHTAAATFPNMPRSSPPISEQDRPVLLTLTATANSLSISKRTLERLIAAGDFPVPVKIGRASR